MRELIYSTLSQAVGVTSVVGANIFTPNLLGTDPVPARPNPPFIIFSQQPSTAVQEVRRTSRAVIETWDIRAYDVRGDYLKIDNLLRTCRDSLLGLPIPVKSASGALCVDIRWMETGLDSEDPDLDMIMKSTTLRFVTNH